MKRIHILRVGCLLALLWCTWACMKDSWEDCGVKVRFRYAYNIKNADAFSEEVSEVQLWVFDAEERLVSVYADQKDCFPSDYVLQVPYLRSGDYTFVAIARSVAHTGKHADFDIPALSIGAPIDSLWAKLSLDERHSSACPLNALLMGVLPVTITGAAQSMTMEMMKCTNTVRILLIPADAGGAWEAGDLDFWIEGKNAWLAYDGSTYQEERVIYRPYYQETLQDSRGNAGSVIVAEMNTSRLLMDLAPRLMISNSQSGTMMMNLNLTWLLSLQAIGEHQKEWSNQEYLDRQDEYTLTFIMNGSTWMQSKIVVNGWVLSLSDIGL